MTVRTPLFLSYTYLIHSVGFPLFVVPTTSAITNATKFAEQIKDLPISYVIVGLSGGDTGDKYLSPHPVLESIGSRATAPKDIDSCSTTIDLSAVPDIDVFDDLVTAMEAINVKVIAYMSATGPPKLKEGEADVFDFGGDGCYVNAAVECLQFGINDSQCSPSARSGFIGSLPISQILLWKPTTSPMFTLTDLP